MGLGASRTKSLEYTCSIGSDSECTERLDFKHLKPGATDRKASNGGNWVLSLSPPRLQRTHCRPCRKM